MHADRTSLPSPPISLDRLLSTDRATGADGLLLPEAAGSLGAATEAVGAEG